MAYYAIYTPGGVCKYRGTIKAETLREAATRAVSDVWGTEARIMARKRLARGKWRVTVRLWNPDNTARYESAILALEPARAQSAVTPAALY